MEYCRLRHQFWSNDVNDVDVTSRTQCWSLQVSHQIFSSVEKPEMSSAFLPISAHFRHFCKVSTFHCIARITKKKLKVSCPMMLKRLRFSGVFPRFQVPIPQPKGGPVPVQMEKVHDPWSYPMEKYSYSRFVWTIYLYYVYIHHHPSSSIIIHHSSSSIIYQPPWNPRSRRIRETKEDEQRATHDLHLAIAHLRSQPPEDVPADSLTKLWAYETYRYI